MDKEKKRKIRFYNWVMVLLINVLAISVLIIGISSNGGFNLQSDTKTVLTLSGILFFATVPPVLLARSESNKMVIFGYGIPVLLLLFIIFNLFVFELCTGDWCQLLPFVIGIASTIFFIIFITVYTLTIMSHGWSEKRVKVISILLPITLTFLLWLVLFSPR